MALYRDQGIVLRARAYRDHDSLVTLFLINHGKVAAVARGTRKAKSPLNAGLYPLSYSGFELYRGRSSLESVTLADPIHGFGRIREDLDRISWATLIAEVVAECFSDRDPAPEAFYILVAGLEALHEGRHPPSVAMGVIWQLLRAAGIVTILDRCGQCGKVSEGSWALVRGENAPRCAACARSHIAKPLSVGAVKTMNRWLQVSPDRVAGVEVRGRLVPEMCAWLAWTMDSHLHRVPRTLEFLQQLLDQEVEEPR